MTDFEPRTIPHDEIRKGDTIRTTYMEYDVEKSVTGTVHSIDYHDRWFTARNMLITTDTAASPIYTLLDRPKPKLPTSPGSVIRIRTFSIGAFSGGDITLAEPVLSFLDADSEWVIVYDGGNKYLRPGNITDWSPLTIEDVKD